MYHLFTLVLNGGQLTGESRDIIKLLKRKVRVKNNL
jgi:hypothetical protein